MKLTLDISQIVHKGTGVARFTDGLVRAALEYKDSEKWQFFFSSLRRKPNRELVELMKEKGAPLISVPIPPTALTFLWNKLHVLGPEWITGKSDWFISSDWTEPPVKAKKATIVHDLAFMRYPETVAKSIRDVQAKRLTRVKQETDVVFADSHTTKNDLVELLGFAEETIHVIYPGVDLALPKIEEITRTQMKFDLHKPFFLAVGKIEPRKNLKRLIEAYISLARDDIQLVIVGPKGWDDIGQEQIPGVRFLGYVSDRELYSLYASCRAFVFPSLFEGFGYPAVEAMRIGCPVALADTSSLAEIGKGCAHMFDPHDVGAIADVLKNLATDKKYLNTYVEKAKEKSKQYSWKKYYSNMMKILSSHT